MVNMKELSIEDRRNALQAKRTEATVIYYQANEAREKALKELDQINVALAALEGLADAPKVTNDDN